MTVYPLQANMTRGALTPYVHARADTEHYAAGLHTAENIVVMRYGGVTRAPGTFFLGRNKNADKQARWLRFEFNRKQVYAIEAGEFYFRFWTRDGRIESPPATPVEVVTPYAEADLKYLRVRQLGDVVYIWCRKDAGDNYQPMRLTRNSETSWTLEPHNVVNGPFLKEDTAGTVFVLASTGAITPDMTDNTTPSGTASSGDASVNAFRVFDREGAPPYEVTNSSGFLAYDLPGAATKVADAYWMQSEASATQVDRTPVSWTFEGFNGVDWVVLDSRTGEGAWATNERRYYDFPNEIAYQSYRVKWTSTGSSLGYSSLAELSIHEHADYQTPFDLTASSANGINDNTGFQPSDVGRSIRLMGSDGRWRTAIIAAVTSTTVVTIRLYGHALPDTSPISRWQMGTFSDESGWPAAGAVYEDRLFHASTMDDPLGLWGSVNADYDNHNVSTPVVADDGVAVRLTGGKLDDISWLVEMKESLVVGTAGSLRAVGRNNDGEALGPSNFRQRQQTLAPSSIAEPVIVENALLYIDLFEQSIVEAMYTYEVDGYLAREATTLNEHLFAAGVAEIVYLSKPHSVIVGRRYDGKLIFYTYDRANKVAGATLVDYGGEVESVLDLPGDTGTDLWMMVKRTVDGGTVRYVERMAEFWRKDFTVQGLPVYAACARMASGGLGNVISGFDHMEGETLGVWADGRDIGDVVVSGGDVTLPGGIVPDDVVIGKRMPWKLQTLRLAQIGNKDGSGLGRRVSIIEGMIDLYESAGINIGSLAQMDEFRYEDDIERDPDEPEPLRTGMFAGPVDDNWRNDGVLVMEGDRLYPATVRAVQLNIDGEP